MRTFAGFARRKRQVVRLLHTAGDAAGGLWLVLDLHRAWHATALPRAVHAFDTLPGVNGSTAKRVTITGLAALTPPVFVWTSRRHAKGPSLRRGGKQITLTKHDGGLVFDHRVSRVTHYRAGPLPAVYEKNRDRLSECFEVPAYEVSVDRRVLREELILGEDLADAPPQVKIEAAHTLLQQSAEVVRHHSGGTSFELVRVALDAVRGGPLAATLASEVRDVAPDLLAASQNWPTALSHGDLTPLNVLLRVRSAPEASATSGEHPIVIDFEDARRLPFFFDALSILSRDQELWCAAQRGEFDTDLERIRIAARSDVRLDLLAAARVVALIAAADHAHRYGGDVAGTFAQLWPESA